MSPSDIHPPDCPEFEYAQHTDRTTEGPRRGSSIFSGFLRGALDTLASAADTRIVHGRLFSGLTPPGHPYFAGHYRGEDYPCLRRCPVFVGGRAGCPPSNVQTAMAELARSITAALGALDA